jgi:hypothetical protein
LRSAKTGSASGLERAGEAEFTLDEGDVAPMRWDDSGGEGVLVVATCNDTPVHYLTLQHAVNAHNAHATDIARDAQAQAGNPQSLVTRQGVMHVASPHCCHATAQHRHGMHRIVVQAAGEQSIIDVPCLLLHQLARKLSMLCLERGGVSLMIRLAPESL